MGLLNRLFALLFGVFEGETSRGYFKCDGLLSPARVASQTLSNSGDDGRRESCACASRARSPRRRRRASGEEPQFGEELGVLVRVAARVSRFEQERSSLQSPALSSAPLASRRGVLAVRRDERTRLSSRWLTTAEPASATTAWQRQLGVQGPSGRLRVQVLNPGNHFDNLTCPDVERSAMHERSA